MTEAEVFDLVACSEEFEQVKVRDEDMKEMDKLKANACRVDVVGGVENVNGKVNVLMQAHISRAFIDNFALVSDSNYVQQSAGRLFRGLFEIALKRGWSHMSDLFLKLCISIDQGSRARSDLAHFASNMVLRLELRQESYDSPSCLMKDVRRSRVRNGPSAFPADITL